MSSLYNTPCSKY